MPLDKLDPETAVDRSLLPMTAVTARDAARGRRR